MVKYVMLHATGNWLKNYVCVGKRAGPVRRVWASSGRPLP